MLDKSKCVAAMDEALSLGINRFDTAEAYALGDSERLIGRWLHDSGADVELFTKFKPPGEQQQWGISHFPGG